MSDLRLAAPIGFLALIGLIILILIYILKPNYQQKFISSTFIWKLSLKFRKRKFPMSKLRNILIIICQVMIIVLTAVMIAQPFLQAVADVPQNEEIIIIDASVSMRAAQDPIKKGDEDPIPAPSRFERAVDEALALSKSAIKRGIKLTVIMAGTTADYLKFTKIEMVNGEEVEYSIPISHTKDGNAVEEAFSSLIKRDETGRVVYLACDYTGADMDGALTMVGELTSGNAGAMVTVYTGSDYTTKNIDSFEKVGGRSKFRIVNLAKMDAEKYLDDKEWNAAVLGCTAGRDDDGNFAFVAKVASYNNDRNISVYLEIFGADDGLVEEYYKIDDVKPEVVVNCMNNNVVDAVFTIPIRSFSHARVYVNERDSFPLDNSYYLYGVAKNIVNVLYVSPAPSEQQLALTSSFRRLGDQWTFNVRSTDLATMEKNGEDISQGGYDIYIIEYYMPKIFPKDGIIIVIAPMEEPTDLGVHFGGLVSKLSQDDELCTLSGVMTTTQLMNLVRPGKILVNQYQKLASYSGYDVLMEVQDLSGNFDPAYLVNQDRKTAIFTFPSVYSDLTVRVDFISIYYNILKSWLPATLEKNEYNVGDTIGYWQTDEILNEFLPKILIQQSDGSKVETTDLDSYFVTQTIYGSYTITQKMHNGRDVVETYFVRIAEEESDFTRTIQTVSITIPKIDIDDDKDLLIYIGIALISFVFIERLLHVKSEF